MQPLRASRGFRGINGVLPAARVPSIYSTVLLTLSRAYLCFTKERGYPGSRGRAKRKEIHSPHRDGTQFHG